VNRLPRSHLTIATFSHAGLAGKKNEDRFAVACYAGASGKAVFFGALSDGIGGHRAGEVAAEIAVNDIVRVVSRSDGTDPLAIMEAGIQSASQAIASRSASHKDEAGMGATCACLWIEGDRLYGAYVGDSRIYLIREEKIQRLTVDHTWVQEAIDSGSLAPEQARHHPNAHVLRRHLGSGELPEVDLRLHFRGRESDEQARSNQGARLSPGDIVLMCTDGLTDMIWDDEILRLITTRNALTSAAEDLVARANERGGHDNITVVLVGVPRLTPAASRKKKGFLQELLRR
jgi:protein phosphatase